MAEAPSQSGAADQSWLPLMGTELK